MNSADSASPPARYVSNDRQFFLRRLVFTLLLSTSLAAIIGFATGTSRGFWSAFIVCHCIGLSILAFATVVRVTLFSRYVLSRSARTITYLLTYPAGIMFGSMLGYTLIGGSIEPGNEYSRYGWEVGLAFGVLVSAVAIVYNMTVTNLAERQRQLELAERASIEAQLRALQAQIEPHFLFNTLANLDALIAVDPAEARGLLGHLIRYLRAALTHARSERASLQTEIDLLQSYLNIMAMRMPDRLHAEFDCEPQALALRFPPMLLQPLVENAITHGIEPAPRGGTVRVSARIENERLMLMVEDTGAGLHAPSKRPGTGAGLQNVRARLHSLFGPEAHLRLEPREPNGTRAVIDIPLHALRP